MRAIDAALADISRQELMSRWDPDAMGKADVYGVNPDDPEAKLREYIDHRNQREQEISAAIEAGLHTIPEIVARVYAAYPVALHIPARSSVCSHLRKLEREGRVRRSGEPPLDAHWYIA